jgi:hypothetical protein
MVEENAYNILVGKKEKDQYEDESVVGRIILKLA